MEEESNKRILDYVPQFLSLLTALCLVTSVIYEAAYFSRFNMSILLLPTTIQDHFKSSISLMPMGAGILSGIYLFVIFKSRYSKKLYSTIDESEYLRCIDENKSYPVPKIIKISSFTSLCFALLTLIFSIYFEIYLLLVLEVLFAILPLYYLFFKLFLHPEADDKATGFILNVSIIAYILFIVVPITAIVNAEKDFKYSREVSIFLKDNERKKIKVKLLRNYEKSIFVNFSSQNVIIPQSDILMIADNYGKKVKVNYKEFFKKQ